MVDLNEAWGASVLRGLLVGGPASDMALYGIPTLGQRGEEERGSERQEGGVGRVTVP